MKTSETVVEIFKALSLFQGEVESPKKGTENDAFKKEGKARKYADLDAIIKAITPSLAKNGLVQMQFASSNVESKTVSVTTLITHTSGEFVESDPIVLPAENTFGKFNAQTIGSAITYGRRYSLSAALGIASEDDDDANTQSLPDKKGSNNNRPKDNKPEKPEQPKEPSLNDAIIGYIDQIKKMGGDIQSIYSDISSVEGKNTIKEVDNVRILGHLKSYALSMQRAQSQTEDVKQESLMKNGTTTAQVDWGNA